MRVLLLLLLTWASTAGASYWVDVKFWNDGGSTVWWKWQDSGGGWHNGNTGASGVSAGGNDCGSAFITGTNAPTVRVYLSYNNWLGGTNEAVSTTAGAGPTPGCNADSISYGYHSSAGGSPTYYLHYCYTNSSSVCKTVSLATNGIVAGAVNVDAGDWYCWTVSNVGSFSWASFSGDCGSPNISMDAAGNASDTSSDPGWVTGSGQGGANYGHNGNLQGGTNSVTGEEMRQNTQQILDALSKGFANLNLELASLDGDLVRAGNGISNQVWVTRLEVTNTLAGINTNVSSLGTNLSSLRTNLYGMSTNLASIGTNLHADLTNINSTLTNGPLLAYQFATNQGFGTNLLGYRTNASYEASVAGSNIDGFGASLQGQLAGSNMTWGVGGGNASWWQIPNVFPGRTNVVDLYPPNALGALWSWRVWLKAALGALLVFQAIKAMQGEFWQVWGAAMSARGFAVPNLQFMVAGTGGNVVGNLLSVAGAVTTGLMLISVVSIVGVLLTVASYLAIGTVASSLPSWFVEPAWFLSEFLPVGVAVSMVFCRIALWAAFMVLLKYSVARSGLPS